MDEKVLSIDEKVEEQSVPVPEPGEGVQQDWSNEDELKLRKKLDWRILPVLCLISAMSFLDRSNISAAYISGMKSDLALAIGNRYSIALLVFFPTYALFELPSNLIIRQVGCANWLSFLIISWGLVTLGCGFVTNWTGLAILRTFLGAFEAGVFPGCIYIIAIWYRTYEMQERVTLFYSASMFSAGLNGIIAYGLSQIKVGGPENKLSQGWRWIYIVEGLLTVVVGLACWYFVPEFPERARWLNEREKHVAIGRISKDRGDGEYDNLSIRRGLRSLLDWKLIVFCLQYYIATCGIYSLSFFMPVILKESLHFSNMKSLLLITPPYALTIIVCLINARLSDRLKIRWPFMIFQAVLAVVGLALVLYAKTPAVRYFGTFFACAGTQANIPGTIAYGQNQIVCQTKRAVTAAAMISFGAAGGITASTVFSAKDSPRYLTGIWVIMGLQIVFIFITGAMSTYLHRQNKLFDSRKIRVLEGVTGFRYSP